MIEPGIHPNLSHADHLALEALSPSGAKDLLRSPAHYRAARDEPRPETPALRIGDATHCLSLEGRAAFNDRFAVAPDGIDRRTKAGKADWAAFTEAAGERTILTAAEAEPVEGMADALHAHPLIPALLERGQAEVSMIWSDAETGAPCKGRPDFARFDDGALLDLKTALDASPAGFTRAAFNFGYHIQAAAYREGAAALGRPISDYLLLTVEKSPPYAAAVYRLADAPLELGRRRWREAVALYSECLERNEWPGYSSSIQELTLPNWAMGELINELED